MHEFAVVWRYLNVRGWSLGYFGDSNRLCMHHSIKRNYILVFYNYQTMNIHQIQYNCVVCGVIRVCTDNHCMYFFYLGFLERIITSKKVTAIYFYNVGCILVKLKLHIMTEST